MVISLFNIIIQIEKRNWLYKFRFARVRHARTLADPGGGAPGARLPPPNGR